MTNTLDKLQSDWETLARRPAYWNSLGHFRGAQGPTWIVTCDEDLNAEKRVIQLTGGQQVGSIS